MKTYSPEEFPVKTEVFSRVVGYIRPVSQWNEGKQEEFRQRCVFDKAVRQRLVQVSREMGEIRQ